MSLQVELVSPERIAFSGEARMVIARVAGGDIAFLPGHVPFIGTLQTHPLRILMDDGLEQVVAVHLGFVEVAHDRVTILSDVCELAETIDPDRARAARERALNVLADQPDDEDAKAALQRADVRLAVAEGAEKVY